MRTDIVCEPLRIFGENLKYIARCKNLTITEFAEYIEYNRTDMGQVFWGNQNIKLNTALKFAERTGHSVSSLFNNSFQDDPDYVSNERFVSEDYLSIFLNSILSHMEEKNISQAEISSRIEMDKAELSRFLSGQIKNPTILTMSKVSEAIDCNLSEMLRKEQK